MALASKSHITTKEGFVNVPGGRIWYKIFSSEKMKSQIPLLLLHGGPGIPHNYLEVLSGLATERPVIFYDQLGCGQSKTIHADKKLWNLSRYVIELNILTEHLKINKFHLFGHSWGGTLGLEYTLEHPDKTATGNLKKFDRINDLKKLNMPVLITGGKFDEATPHTLKMAVNELPIGKLIIYEKSAHFAFLNENKKYLNDLKLFLNSSDL